MSVLFFCPLISTFFLFYLVAFSHPVIVNDAIGYEQLAKLFVHGDWVSYFQTGPNREPLYLLFVAAAMKIGSFLHVPYTAPLLLMQVMVLLSAQLILMAILKHFQIVDAITAVISIYFVVSPNIFTSSLIVFSEILIYPLILLFVFLLYQMMLKVTSGPNDWREFSVTGIQLGLCAAVLTYLKGIFEVAVPLILILLLFIVFKNQGKISLSVAVKKYLVFTSITLIVFLGAVVPVKYLNKIYNNTFTFTDRGPTGIYGNIVRNSTDMTYPKLLAGALTIIPDKRFCRRVFPDDMCGYWDNGVSDKIGAAKEVELSKQFPPDEVNKRLILLSAQRFMQHPLESFAAYLINASRFFFWEFFSPSFVAIPGWVKKVYRFAPLYYFLLFSVPLASLASFFFAVKKTFFCSDHGCRKRQTFLAVLTCTIIAFIAEHSFSFTSERYALELAPLFLVLIAFFLDRLIFYLPSTKNRQS